MKKIVLILIALILPGVTRAESSQEITLTARQTIQLAGQLFDHGDYDRAKTILTQIPTMPEVSLEIERWFLLGQISARRGDLDTAIKIYRKILDGQPDLSRVRFELAICYMHKKQWSRADYHLRLAMAGKDLTDDVKNMMKYYRYMVRKNKNWNVWFNFGAAPDNNINQVAGGEECINTIWGPFCRQLPEPVSAIGYNLILGGNYEFKLDENWRWKSDASLYTNIYNLHNYDDLYLSASTGPRYVWSRGDVWVAGIAGRRWYGWDGYNWSYGVRSDINYDFTRKLSGGLGLRVLDNNYDNYGPYMNGQSYSANPRISYSLDATKYIILRGGLERDITKDEIYTNWRPSVGIGFGAEMPLGFHVYVEPNFSWLRYDGERWVVHDGKFTEMREKDFIQRYSMSLSNNKLEIWGFVPTLTLSYTKRNSNIHQREYDKTTIEFTMQQRF